MNEKIILRYQIRIPLQHNRGGLYSSGASCGLSQFCLTENVRNAAERRKTMYTKVNAKSITIVGVLVAIEIILTQFFTVHTWNLKIGFSFIPVVVAAILFGPVTAGLVAAIGDVVCAVLFPVGAFFPGFTLTAFLTGIIYGLCFRKSTSLKNVLCAVLIKQLAVSQVLNTYWISFLYGSPYLPLFITRLYQTAVMILVECAVIVLITKKLIPMLKGIENI